MKVRTRFAPSPTGFMHIGNLRAALYSYLIAKHNNGEYILRIEDTDQSRKQEGAIEFIYDTCKLCGITFDEGPNNPGNYGPYIQSERKDIYLKYAKQLIDEGKAYYCFCTEERLEVLRKKATKRKQAFMYDGHCKNLTKEEIEENLKNNVPYVIRFNMPKEGTSSYEDIVFGKIEVDNSILEDIILIKSDGYPTYNFANVIDDHLMNITHVSRGNEYLMTTPKYNHIYDAFGWEKPTYIHMPTVNGSDNKKLSKRNGDASFMDLYNEGYLPEAVINYLALLGWSSENNKEIFTKEELIKEFDPHRIGKAPAIYDVKKLNWFNSHYIKELDLEELKKLTLPFLEEAYDLKDKSSEWINELILLHQNYIDYGKEIIDATKLFFESDITLENDAKEFMESDEKINKTIEEFTKHISDISSWTIENIKEAINKTKETSGNKGKLLFMPIRIKTTGLMHGPELANTLHLLGKEKVVKRLKG